MPDTPGMMITESLAVVIEGIATATGVTAGTAVIEDIAAVTAGMADMTVTKGMPVTTADMVVGTVETADTAATVGMTATAGTLGGVSPHIRSPLDTGLAGLVLPPATTLVNKVLSRR